MNGFRSKSERKIITGAATDVFAQTGRFGETLPTPEARFGPRSRRYVFNDTRIAAENQVFRRFFREILRFFAKPSESEGKRRVSWASWVK
jgi:hypothetical protein